jgi:hypothetical protein
MPGPEAEHSDLLWMLIMPGAIFLFTHTPYNLFLNYEGHSLCTLTYRKSRSSEYTTPSFQVVQVVNRWPKTGYFNRGISGFSSFLRGLVVRASGY